MTRPNLVKSSSRCSSVHSCGRLPTNSCWLSEVESILSLGWWPGGRESRPGWVGSGPRLPSLVNLSGLAVGGALLVEVTTCLPWLVPLLPLYSLLLLGAWPWGPTAPACAWPAPLKGVPSLLSPLLPAPRGRLCWGPRGGLDTLPPCFTMELQVLGALLSTG